MPHADLHNILLVSLLNWAAPSVTPQHIQKEQLHVVSWALSENKNNVCLLVMPAHTNPKNKLYVLEQSVLTKLSKYNMVFDTPYCILFQNKVDARDGRPMTYQRRFP